MHIDRTRALQALLDAWSEPAWLIDERHVVRAANRALARSLGVEIEALLGEPAPERMSQRFGEHAQRMEAAFAGARVVFEQVAGGRRLLHQLEPVLDDAGRVWAVALFTTDVSSVTTAEASAQGSEDQFRAIVGTCLEGVWQIDAETRTRFMNEQMATMLGYTVEECLGRKLHEFMDGSAWADAQRALARRKQGIRERFEFRFRHKLGRDVWAVVSAAPVFDAAGDYLGALALVTDVTEARVLERKVQHTQKLESLGVLAGGIAHDFNNVLAGILGNVGLAQVELPPGSRASFFLKEAELAAQRAADLTRQMLAYSGRGAFVVDVIDLNATIREVQSLLSTVVSKKAALNISLGANLPPMRGDATQIRQVLMNLVMNASDALEGGPGSIRVSTSLIEASAADLGRSYLDDALEPGPYLAVEVSDTGSGMSREVLGRIFEPFFSTKSAGHGLGLAAVLGILRAHNAAVIVDSEPGRGTSFKIWLPALKGATLRVRSEPGGPRPAPRANARVLVADDEEAVLTVTCKTLERLGYECVRCSNGAEALARLSEGEPEVDIALLDLTMPELGGGEVLTELRRRGTTTPVILMSGFGASDTSPELLSAGPMDFIEKPFVPGELSRRIQRIIGPKK
ncbi:MAG TPA: PAS domain S-box protein [Polyangiaceae bacterium]